ncbi:MAG: PQQ-like beta-propeller repeat protein [Myxococcota bacterium]|nr:PQQ-like beta-propeller repeat protein [Myxococcota bacterium]
MKAIRVTCPNCGATLRVAESAITASCEYCGTASSIMRRTRILERVIAPSQSSMPRAVQRHTRGWIMSILLVTVIAPIVFAGVCVVTTVRRVSVDLKIPSTVTTTYTAPANRAATWQGTDSVLVADVNGDGTAELIGRVRRVNAGDIVMLTALDLATGKPVWTGDVLGTYLETYQGPFTLAGDLILHASESGELRAYALANGKLRWNTKLDERVAYFCPGAAAGTIDAVGADDVIRPINRDGTLGTKRDAPKKRGREELCKRLPSDAISAFEIAKRAFSDDKQLGKKTELYVDVVVTGPGGRVLGGSRAKGTHVTTLVGLDDKDGERWRVTASPDGLGSEGAPRNIVVGEQEVCIIYYAKDYRTACFAMADGKRRWDAETPSFFEDLIIVGRSLIVTGGELRVHDLDTGAVRWRFD